MSPVLRFLLVMLALECGSLPASAAPEAALERGTAIVDPGALHELDGGRFGLGRILEPARASALPLSNAELFALPAMAPVKAAVDAEFDRYVERHKAELASESIGVAETFDFQLFD